MRRRKLQLAKELRSRNALVFAQGCIVNSGAAMHKGWLLAANIIALLNVALSRRLKEGGCSRG